MSTRDQLSGTILANRYKVGELLGAGGFGSTYHATDQARFNARCVVKELLPTRRNDFTARRLFEREARLLSQLSHPQIPTLQAYFEEEGRFYLVQDFVAGQTLKARLQRVTRLPEAEVRALIFGMLGVLQYLHEREPPVIHRDIKPANLILGDNGTTYLIDFGAVREVLTDDSHTAIGTAGYTPREQAVGHARPASDIYALGATALEAISGEHPLEWHDKATGNLDWQGKLDCSPEFENLLSGLLADVQHRFSSATQVRDAMTGDVPFSVRTSGSYPAIEGAPVPNTKTDASVSKSIGESTRSRVVISRPTSAPIVADNSASAPIVAKVPTPAPVSSVGVPPQNSIASESPTKSNTAEPIELPDATDSTIDQRPIAEQHTSTKFGSRVSWPLIAVSVAAGLAIVAVLSLFNDKGASAPKTGAETSASADTASNATPANTAAESLKAVTPVKTATDNTPSRAADSTKAPVKKARADSTGAPSAEECDRLLQRLSLGDPLTPEEKARQQRCK